MCIIMPTCDVSLGDREKIVKDCENFNDCKLVASQIIVEYLKEFGYIYFNYDVKKWKWDQCFDENNNEYNKQLFESGGYGCVPKIKYINDKIETEISVYSLIATIFKISNELNVSHIDDDDFIEHVCVCEYCGTSSAQNVLISVDTNSDLKYPFIHHFYNFDEEYRYDNESSQVIYSSGTYDEIVEMKIKRTIQLTFIVDGHFYEI